MLSQQILLECIIRDFGQCLKAEHTTESGKAQRRKEIDVLVAHYDMAEIAGDDQRKLEEVVRSLEQSPVRMYQKWRQCATV